MLKTHVSCSKTLNLLKKYLYHVEINKAGNYSTVTQGLSKASSISSLLGALYLSKLDKACENVAHVKYVRYMDDIFIMSKTKYHLKLAIKKMWTILNSLQLEVRFEKTCMGKISIKKFDFLGIKFSKNGIIHLANKCIKNFIIKQEYLKSLSKITSSLSIIKTYNLIKGLRCYLNGIINYPNKIHLGSDFTIITELL
tara:strand:+ start:490 stop:1080 length:591 start_codon:yes stop_codon:yes gene_type:complete